jgi:hypothetical protein
MTASHTHRVYQSDRPPSASNVGRGGGQIVCTTKQDAAGGNMMVDICLSGTYIKSSQSSDREYFETDPIMIHAQPCVRKTEIYTHFHRVYLVLGTTELYVEKHSNRQKTDCNIRYSVEIIQTSNEIVPPLPISVVPFVCIGILWL